MMSTPGRGVFTVSSYARNPSQVVSPDLYSMVSVLTAAAAVARVAPRPTVEEKGFHVGDDTTARNFSSER